MARATESAKQDRKIKPLEIPDLSNIPFLTMSISGDHATTGTRIQYTLGTYMMFSEPEYYVLYIPAAASTSTSTRPCRRTDDNAPLPFIGPACNAS